MDAIIELSRSEAQSGSRQIVGTEHLLLGLAREGHGVANVILYEYGVSADSIRDEVLDLSGRRSEPN
jgi:ATP-dependent Clp protease ATP-binding subunit ClpC